MDEPVGLNFGLGSLPMLSAAKTRSICAENPDGAKGGGAKAVPDAGNPGSDLGTGWKIRPCIDLPARSTTTLAEIEGPGVIQHIWITVDPKAYRNCILRFCWDGEKTPSIEVPLGDFFANAHGMRYKVNSLPVAVNPQGGFNCYWPMPFRKQATIAIENQWHDEIGGFFYQITYALTDVPAEAGYFHAQWRRAVTRRDNPDYTILDGAKGRGHYVGTMLSWTQLANGWWPNGKFQPLADDIASVAYWYQTEPHASFPKMPPPDERWSR